MQTPTPPPITIIDLRSPELKAKQEAEGARRLKHMIESARRWGAC